MSDLIPGGYTISKELNDAIRKYMEGAERRHPYRHLGVSEVGGVFDPLKMKEPIPEPEIDMRSITGASIVIKPDYNPELIDKYMKNNDKFEFDLKPGPESKFYDVEPEINMAPHKQYIRTDEDFDYDMRPAPEHAYHDDEPEINMAPAKEFVSYDVEPEKDMTPAKQFTSPTISLVEFKTKYPSFFDESGNIKTEALEIIDGLLDMFFKTKKGDTDTPHIEREYIVKSPAETKEPEQGPKLGL